MVVDQAKLEVFMGKVVTDLGATLNTGLVLIGEQLGLYRAMADSVPITSERLAAKTCTDERYVREWLAAQAAGGYVDYDPASRSYRLSPEQAEALANAEGCAYMPGGFQACMAMLRDMPKICDAFRTGHGVDWPERDPDLFEGTERFFRPGYMANLVNSWLPALEGVAAKLEQGGKVADIGCGHGASTILMGKAYPHSTFTGFDFHQPSVEWARKTAEKAGVADRVKFEVAAATRYPGTDYDLVACFDCLHDMGDPIGAAKHIKASLAPGGTLMLVEPFAKDKVEDNLNAVGRVFYAASTLVCTAVSKSQEVGLALGAQAGQGRLTEVLRLAGFSKVRLAAQTPFNLVLEAKV